MLQNNQIPAFSEQKLKAMMQSAEGQKLLQLLNRNGGETLRRASQAAQSGNYQAALQMLQPALQTQEGSDLLSSLQKNHG